MKAIIVATAFAACIWQPAQAGEGDFYEPDQHKGNSPFDVDERVLQKPFQSTAGSQYGVIGNVGRPVIGGHSMATDEFLLDESEIKELFTSEEGAAARNQILGCGVIDQHAAMVTALDVREEQVNDYIGSKLGTYMLTTLYNSPALAAVYDSVESFGAKRVQLMRDRCQAVQTAASQSSEDMMRWQALQECVRRNVGAANLAEGSAVGKGDGYRDGKEAMAYAAAYRACIYGSQGQIASFTGDDIKAHLVAESGGDAEEVIFRPQDAFTEKNSLEEVLEISLLSPDKDELKPSMWTGGLLGALKSTSLCYSRGGGGASADEATEDKPANDCAIMAFIPNVRWCVGSQRDKRSCLNQEKPRLSNALFTPLQVFDISYALAQVEVNYRYKYAEALAELVGDDNSMDIAVKGELLQEPMQEAEVADQKLSSDVPDAELMRYYGCFNGFHISTAEDFSKYVNRAYNLKITKNDEEQSVLDLDEKMVSSYKTSAKNDSRFAKVKDLAEKAGTIITRPANLNVSKVMSDLAEVNKLDHGDYMTGNRAASGNPAVFFIQTAVRCAMQSYVRGTLADYLSITKIKDDGERNAILMAMRARTAQTATEMLYRFVKEKLSQARMELAYAGPSGSVKATPPHIRRTVDNVMSLLDGQLAAMDAIQSRQTGFADLLSRLRPAETGVATPNPAK